MRWIPGPCLLAVLVPALAAAQDAPRNPLGRVHTVRAPGGPVIAVRPQPEVPLVAIRLAVRVEEPPVEAGAARALQRLAQPELERAAREYGARVRLERDATHAIYTVVGPARGFEAYVGMLRAALAARDAAPGRIASLRALVDGEATAQFDTPEPLLRRRLHRALFPAVHGAESAVPTAELTVAALARFWHRTMRPERMQVVVAGDVAPDDVADAFDDWRAAAPDPPAGPAREEGTDPRDPPEPPEPQVLFPWVAHGYTAADDASAAALAISARLVRDRLDESFLRTGRAELWWAPGGQRALVLIGSVSPSETRALAGSLTDTVAAPAGSDSLDAGADAAAPLQPGGSDTAVIAGQLRQALSRTASLVAPAQVARARRGLRRDMLFAARTPHGMATVLGEFLQRTGDARNAVRFLDALDGVDAARVRVVLRRLAADRPISVQVSQ